MSKRNLITCVGKVGTWPRQRLMPQRADSLSMFGEDNSTDLLKRRIPSVDNLHRKSREEQFSASWSATVDQIGELTTKIESGIPDVQDVINAKIAALDALNEEPSVKKDAHLQTDDDSAKAKLKTKLVQLTIDDKISQKNSEISSVEGSNHISNVSIVLSQPSLNEQESTVNTNLNKQEGNDKRDTEKINSVANKNEKVTEEVAQEGVFDEPTISGESMKTSGTNLIKTMVFTRSDKQFHCQEKPETMTDLLSYSNPTYSVNDFLLSRIQNSMSAPPWRTCKIMFLLRDLSDITFASKFLIQSFT